MTDTRVATAGRVWINVTTSANWKRPAVGIVRVEQALARHLRVVMGENCHLCVWQDDRFVEWEPPIEGLSVEEERAVDAFVPRGPAFDLARPFLARAVRRFAARADLPPAGRSLALSVPTDNRARLSPGPGDFLISIGLDWDMPYAPRFHDMARRQGLRIITCCYDLIPVLFPQYCVGEVAKRFTEYFLDLSWGSEAVLCISEQTRHDYESLCERLGAPQRRTQVIPLGDNIPQGDPVLSEAVLAATKDPFLLFVSTIERRKNHEVLYRAYHLLAKDGRVKQLPKLVFVGMHGWGIGDLMKDIELDPLTKNLIVTLNDVSDGELSYLYRHALFCLYPSLYEGWGLPVGEALAMGKAVLSSDEGSLPEVGSDLVRYVPAWNPYAWADAIAEYVNEPQRVAEAEYQVQSRYQPREWSAMATCVAELIGDLAREPKHYKVFFPGYDMSTLSGVHDGPAIQSGGRSGVLMFGPHVAMPAGRYDVRIEATLLDDSEASVGFSAASRGGGDVHARADVDLVGRPVGPFELLLSINLDGDVPDLEVKCEVETAAWFRIDRVSLKPAGASGRA